MTRGSSRLIALVLSPILAVGCRRAGTAADKAEPPVLNVTHWTEKTELYMEYPPLVTGQPARFAVHLTKLDDFKALSAGASYDEGAPLFKIVRTDRVELRAQVPATEVASTRGVASLAFEIPGRPDAIVLQPHHMHDAGIIDPQTRALPVQFEVENPGGQLLVGQTGTAVLYKSDRVRAPVVPKAAVLLEAGRPYVFIQVGGERFARRYVEIATRDGDLIGVRTGLQPGDRVVIKGAYDVQLASAAKGLPAEGHVH